MKCIICGNAVSSRQVRTRDGTRQKLFLCRKCDFAFFKKDRSDLIAQNKFEQKRLLSAGLSIPGIKTDFDNGYRQSLGYIKSYIGAGDRGKDILEIGCSWGYFLKALKGQGINPVGLEINPVRAGFVRKNLKIPCYHDLSELEDSGRTFKKIFLFYVIQYISEPVDYFKRLINLLQTGGNLYIITPNNHDVLKDVWGIPEYHDFFYEKMSVGYYSVKSLKALSRIIGRDCSISYQIETKQGYSFFNHLMWYFTGKPRTTGLVGGDLFAADIAGRLESFSLGLKLARMVKEFDLKYRRQIERESSGNQVILKITK